MARHEAGSRASAGIGIVLELFPAGDKDPDYAVSVKMRDTGLVFPRVPIATGAMGFASIPAVDDVVVVIFMDGDYHAPVVVGQLYTPAKEPPEHNDDNIVLRLPAGNDEPELNIEITRAKPSLTLTLSEDVSLEILKDSVAVKVGDMNLTLTTAGGGRAELGAGGSTIVMKKDGDITMTAKTKLTIEAQEIEISGQSQVKISGAKVDIN
uniref:Gp5/Type VI secretion system Vgr protein OB-fold domain-containing protein n=1 Tax=uncultured Desulfobacterium sp. TaxID=201089 RepID=E1YEL8_9BACT|nr:hypothetical protein N47_P17170 [uncultured Desulfobacterium sp.]